MADDTGAKPPDADNLVATLLARLGAAKRDVRDDGDDPDEPSGGKVSVERLRREIARRRAIEEQVAAIGAEVGGLRKAHTDALAALRAEAATQVQAIGAQHVEDLALVDAGLTDPLGRAALRSAWGALPEAQRGKSAADWWRTSLEARAAHVADETKPAPEIPRTLTAYLPTPAPAPGNGKQTPAAPTPAAPGKATGQTDIAAFDATTGMDALLRALRPRA